jgi:hypothetical protein
MKLDRPPDRRCEPTRCQVGTGQDQVRIGRKLSWERARDRGRLLRIRRSTMGCSGCHIASERSLAYSPIRLINPNPLLVLPLHVSKMLSGYCLRWFSDELRSKLNLLSVLFVASAHLHPNKMARLFWSALRLPVYYADTTSRRLAAGSRIDPLKKKRSRTIDVRIFTYGLENE